MGGVAMLLPLKVGKPDGPDTPWPLGKGSVGHGGGAMLEASRSLNPAPIIQSLTQPPLSRSPQRLNLEWTLGGPRQARGPWGDRGSDPFLANQLWFWSLGHSSSQNHPNMPKESRKWPKKLTLVKSGPEMGRNGCKWSESGKWSESS